MSYTPKDEVKRLIKESKKDLRDMRKAVVKNLLYQSKKKLILKPFSFNAMFTEYDKEDCCNTCDYFSSFNDEKTGFCNLHKSIVLIESWCTEGKPKF